MSQVLELIKKRRTTRAYKSEQIKDEELNQILEAGLSPVMKTLAIELAAAPLILLKKWRKCSSPRVCSWCCPSYSLWARI